MAMTMTVYGYGYGCAKSVASVDNVKSVDFETLSVGTFVGLGTPDPNLLRFVLSRRSVQDNTKCFEIRHACIRHRCC